jgi:predicted RNA-binding protein
MCQATVYLAQDGQEKEIMRDVVLLEPYEEGLRLQAFFEEPVVIKAPTSINCGYCCPTGSSTTPSTRPSSALGRRRRGPLAGRTWPKRSI